MIRRSAFRHRHAIALAVLSPLVLLPASAHTDRSAEHRWTQRAPADSNPVVMLHTSRGEIRIELYPDKAPNTVENFLRLVRSGFYEEMLFHRIERDFIIQAGLLDMEGQVRKHEMEPLESEADNQLKNMRGTVAMAREGRPHTATTEFFINVRDNWGLNFKSYNRADWGYAVFGDVIEGMDVVDEISRIPTRRLGPFTAFPAEPVAIYMAYVLEPDN